MAIGVHGVSPLPMGIGREVKRMSILLVIANYSSSMLIDNLNLATTGHWLAINVFQPTSWVSTRLHFSHRNILICERSRLSLAMCVMGVPTTPVDAGHNHKAV